MTPRLIAIAIACLSLSACVTDGMGSAIAPAGQTEQGGSRLQNLPVFLDKLDSARGHALSVADRAAVGGIATQTKSMMDGAQNAFIDKIGNATGLGGDALRAIVPSAAAPVSDNHLVTGLEGKLGHKLPDADARIVKTANALRNNSLATLKDGFAGKVGDVTGVGKDTVVALMPLLGF